MVDLLDTDRKGVYSVLITLPIAVDKDGKISAEQYARIANGVVQVEVLTTAEARVYLIEPSQASFD